MSLAGASIERTDGRAFEYFQKTRLFQGKSSGGYRLSSAELPATSMSLLSSLSVSVSVCRETVDVFLKP